ncbi:class I SAM-dependent methyltransferase [Fodinibacter luteus]|uniref:Class I SAM-dependent methyltransferase n=1 Tax=Fodinibacter luteus TaxID=552064 RepID=A0ABP8K1Y4_9MICO
MDASAWDARYAAADLVWSAEPNVWVREVCGPLPPGRALDVAAGEGRNALWLVEQGWRVLATDYSPVAVARMVDIADRRLGARRAELTARVADATLPPPVVDGTAPGGTASDLVLLVYLHLPREEWRAALAAAVGAAAPGGVVLVVAHALRNLHEGVGGPQDPAVLLDPGDVVASAAGLPVDVDLAELRERPVEGADRPALDTVVLFRRRAS